MDLIGDYQDEVERLSPEQIDAVLSGEDHSSRPLATLIQDVRVVLLEDPAPEIAVRHLAAMAKAAERSKPGWAATVSRTRSLRRSPRRRAAAVALAAALLLVAGIAAAVTLPNQSAKPDQDSVPSEAPSLAPAPEDPSAPSNHGQAVSEVATDPALTGCEKGQAVSDVASANAAEKRRNSTEKNDHCSRAGSQSKAKAGRPDDLPAGPGDGSRGRSATHAVGGPSEKGGRNPGTGGAVGGEDHGKGGGGGGIPEELPTP